jgi:hypothetical protein
VSIVLYAVIALLSCDPRLTALFTPEHPRVGRYQVCTTSDALEAVVAASPKGLHYGAPVALEPLDAFGTAGPYDRAAVAQLYRGTRARVARGWTEQNGVLESRTLISPYPDATLTHLSPGTMIITLTLTAEDRGGRRDQDR